MHSFPESATKHLTSGKATAIIKLAGAIGGRTTPKGLLAKGTVHLSDGDSIDLKASDASRIDAVARKLAEPAKKPRKTEKLDGVRVDEIAANKAEGGKMRITASVADAKKLGHALIRAAR